MAMQKTQSALIEGKVATILNTRELTINRGSLDGVEAGMRFKIVDENAAVIDPDTKEELGTIAREKIRVRVIDAQPRFSIAHTYETYKVEEPIRNQSMFAPPTRTITKVRTLASESLAHIDAYDESKGFVGVGDRVVQVD